MSKEFERQIEENELVWLEERENASTKPRSPESQLRARLEWSSSRRFSALAGF